MNNKIIKFYLLVAKSNKMNDTEILFSDNITYEEKCKAANNIINNHELPLTIDQILYATEITLYWLNNEAFKNCYKYNRLFLFNNSLNINKNMYTAMILALCDDFKPENLRSFIIFNDNTPINIGLNESGGYMAMRNYKKLLDYYDFDINNTKEISEESRKIIQAYRTEKYTGKSTKCAVKK